MPAPTVVGKVIRFCETKGFWKMRRKNSVQEHRRYILFSAI